MNKRDKYTNLEIDVPSDIQKMVVDVVMHEGELREQDKILALLIDNEPLMEDENYSGYMEAVKVLTDYIYGPDAEEAGNLIAETDAENPDDPE